MEILSSEICKSEKWTIIFRVVEMANVQDGETAG